MSKALTKKEEAKYIKEATGSDSPLAGKILMAQAINATSSFNINGESINTCTLAQRMLEGIRPEDHLEGMLAVQMVAMHNMALDCSRRAMLPCQTSEGRDMNMRHATKLINAFTNAINTLDKRRGKGQQKITVEHQQVLVESGGQAVIGDIHHGGGKGKNE